MPQKIFGDISNFFLYIYTYPLGQCFDKLSLNAAGCQTAYKTSLSHIDTIEIERPKKFSAHKNAQEIKKLRIF